MPLFRKNIEPRCAYCEKGSLISEEQVACRKRGVVNCDDHCAGFVYDPLKRVPPRPALLDTGKMSEEDFAL